MWAADDDSLSIHGSRGRIEIPSAFFGVRGKDGFSVLVDDTMRYESVPPVNHYTLQAVTVSRAVRDGSPLRYDRLDPVRGAAALEACVQSFQIHERVEIVRGEEVQVTDESQLATTRSQPLTAASPDDVLG